MNAQEHHDPTNKLGAREQESQKRKEQIELHFQSDTPVRQGIALSESRNKTEKEGEMGQHMGRRQF